MSKSIDPAFLSCRFARRLEWEEGDGGLVTVLRPRFGERSLGRRLAGALRLADYRIRLDDVGSLVWRHCDRQTPAAAIVAELRTEFGKRVEPAEHRLHDFIVQMSRARMIEIIGG